MLRYSESSQFIQSNLIWQRHVVNKENHGVYKPEVNRLVQVVKWRFTILIKFFKRDLPLINISDAEFYAQWP